MTAVRARTTLDEMVRLDAVARRPRTAVWFPLLVFGLINVPGAFLAWAIGREHLGLYFLPANLIGGSACAWHYWRTGRTTGLQAPMFTWLAVVVCSTALAAAFSATGRELGLDALNLAGPAVSFMVGYALLGLWARSTTLLTLVSGMGIVAVVVLAFAHGDTAIGLQAGGFAVLMLALAGFNYHGKTAAP